MIEAHAMPSPMIGRNSRYRLVRLAKMTSPTAAHSRQMMCTHLAPRRRASPTSGNATRNVTMLYQPLTSPVHDTASAYRGSVAPTPYTDLAIESDTYCQ